MTIIEVTIASFLLAITALATLSLVDTSTRSTFRAEQTQAAINIAQQEMERLHELDYGALALIPPLPPVGTDENDPTTRIEGDQLCLDRTPVGQPCPAGASAPLVLNGGGLEGGGQVTGGQVEPLSEDVTIGDVTVDIYRFVVWQDEGDELFPSSNQLCEEKPLHFLCKTQDYKRAVVAVRIQEAAVPNEHPYVEVQSDFIDPDRSVLDAPPLGPGGPDVTGQQFWLSDARCEPGEGDPDRPAPSSHPTHDTLGDCVTLANDAPDALLTSPPVDPALVDYSTDIEPGGCSGEDCGPDDVGLQMLEQSGPCTSSPTGADAIRQIHRWLSTPMPTGFQFEMTDKATLELWTRTIDDVPGASGELCAYLLKRSAGVDTIVATASYSDSNWPFGRWTAAPIEFDLSSLSQVERTVLPTERLGVSIGVDPVGTPDNVLQFLYDHPDGRSRLEVLTTTPLP